MTPWFVVNPRAGLVRSGEVTDAIRLRLAGREAAISRELPAALAGARLVVAVGGDGTVSRVINGCDLRRLRLGILPRGSANDLGVELGIPLDLARAWDVLEAGVCEQIDLISVNGSRFATCGGFGLASEVAGRANRWKAQPGWRGPATRRLGPFVYGLAALAQLAHPAARALPVTIRASGVTHRLRLGAALFSNQACFGRWFSASPQASNRDGSVHFCGVEATESRAQLLKTLAMMLDGRRTRRSGVVDMRARSMTIETGAEVSFFGDGEILAHGRRFHVEVLPGALTVVTGRTVVSLAEAA